MVKSISTIYLDSDLLIEAKQKQVNISAICNEAIYLALQKGEEGSTAQAVGKFINNKVEERNSKEQYNKNVATLRKIFQKTKIGELSQIGYLKALKLFCNEYKIGSEQAQAIAEVEGGV